MNNAPSYNMSRPVFLAYAALLILVWGSAFTMVDVAVISLSPIWLVASRIALAAVLVTAYIHIKGLRLPKLSDARWRWYAVMGTTGMVVPFFLIGEGQRTIDSGISAILIGAMPLITIILAHFFTEERMTPTKLLGFVIGFCGIIILFLPKNFSLSLVADWKAQSLVLSAAFCYGLTTVTAKRAPKTDSEVGAAMMLICGAIIAMVWAFAEGIPSSPPDPIAYWMVLGLAIGSTGIATIIYLHMIDVKGPTTLAAINYFVPVASVLFGVWLLNEKITLQVIMAFITIIIGVMVSRIAPSRPNLTPKPTSKAP